jgi:hypothetical protein
MSAAVGGILPFRAVDSLDEHVPRRAPVAACAWSAVKLEASASMSSVR